MLEQAFTYTARGEVRRVIARRKDRPWGHALDLEIFDGDGRPLNRVSFACHPEFQDFESFQAKTTEELMSAVIERLRSGEHESLLSKARTGNLHLFFRFNGSSENAAQLGAAPDANPQSADCEPDPPLRGGPRR
jgi:hypothetical protein